MGLSGATAYSKTSATTGVENADPHRLIQMLIDGAIEKINRAKFFLHQCETFYRAGRTHDELNEILKHFNETKLVGTQEGILK